MSTLRKANQDDTPAIKEIYTSAFPENESDSVTNVAISLLEDCNNCDENPSKVCHSLVALRKDTVVGHISFSPVADAHDKDFRGYILAPLAIHLDYQKQGIGSELIKCGLQQLRDVGVHLVFVYGDPNYYGRFGFREDVAKHSHVGYDLTYPSGWQGVVMNEYNSDVSTTRKLVFHSALCDKSLW